MMNVFPNPKYYVSANGQFTFTDNVTFYISPDFLNDGFIKIAEELWNSFTSEISALHIVKGVLPSKTAYITVGDKFVPPADIKTDYEYELVVDENGIAIHYNDDLGLIHGFYTALQMISPYHRKEQNFTVDACCIKDKPSLEFRGIHFVVFMGEKLEFIKKVIRMCAFMKCTHVCIEFFGTLRLECNKATGWDGAFTKSQIAELVRDGMAMGLEFIPFFNHFGHATQSRFRAGKHVFLDQDPTLEELFDFGGWNWNIHNSEAIELISNIRHELSELMPGKYFHIGCDEVYPADRRVNPYDEKDNNDFINYINSVCESVKKEGRTPIVWADMFIDGTKYPYPYCSNVSYRCLNCEDNLKAFDRNAILCDWQYNIDVSKPETVELLLQHHSADNMILAPWHKFSNIAGRCSLAKKYGMRGILGTTWDLLHAQFRSVVYTSCVAWDEDERYIDNCTTETIMIMAMQNMRKLNPSNGSFENAGTFSHEIDSIVGTTG